MSGSPAPISVHVTHVAAEPAPMLLVHAGAGGLGTRSEAEDTQRHAGLARALDAGSAVLQAGGTALDAVCAAVEILEDEPLFNAGIGAALTADGTAELDAAVMTGTGLGGAVAASRWARHPVRAARAVMERSPHVLLVSPRRELLGQWRVETCEPDVFITERAKRALAARMAHGQAPWDVKGHGTVGAVALDASGALAAATSTGGITGQMPGRVGDSPLLGAGTWAQDGVVALSATGQGEYFVRAALAKDVAARMEYAGTPLAQACSSALEERIAEPGGDGGLIAVAPSGQAVVAFTSEAMLRGIAYGTQRRTWVV